MSSATRPCTSRYDTGLQVSDNGRRLAELVEQLVRSWPVEIAEVALVGHSMGGLMARSACRYGRHRTRPGTTGFATCSASARRTSARCSVANVRDEFPRDGCSEVPFLPTATYYSFGATVSRDSNDPFGRVGASCWCAFRAPGDGPAATDPVEIDNGCHLGGLNHVQLPGHPAVYDHIRGWLERDVTRRQDELAAAPGP